MIIFATLDPLPWQRKQVYTDSKGGDQRGEGGGEVAKNKQGPVEAAQPDTTEPSPERKAELRAAYDANVKLGKPPYDGVAIRTRGELNWVMNERGWSSDYRWFMGHLARTRSDGTESVREVTDLRGAVLQALDLSTMELILVNFSDADLTDANLAHANLYSAKFVNTKLFGTDMRKAELDDADMTGADAREVNLFGASLDSAILRDANLERANLSEAKLTLVKGERARFGSANLSKTTLLAATFEAARFLRADFTRASANADFTGADLTKALLFGTVLDSAHLDGAVLSKAQMDVTTSFDGVTLNPATRVDDVVWNGAPLEQIDWTAVDVLGEEATLAESHTKVERGGAYRRIARTYTQLATAMRVRGLTLQADEFAYRAQTLNRKALWLDLFVGYKPHWVLLARRMRWVPRPLFVPVLRATDWLGCLGRYVTSIVMWALAGYGYRPLRTLFWYLAVIGSFAFAYFQATHGLLTFGLPPSQIQPLHWYEALVLSVSSFHGRGFFQPVQSLGDPVAILAAIEAVFGLFIEVSFIATFTQRYFGK